MRKLLTILALAATGQFAQADVLLSNGNLTVNILSSSGAVGSVLFGGTEFYREGTFVANFGLQNGANAATFQLNTTLGAAGTPVAVAGTTTAIVTGTYTGGGTSVGFTRTYSLVPGLNVLQTTTVFTNNTGSAVALRYFDTGDPDQGVDLGLGFSTFNNVGSISGIPVGISTANGGTGYTVVVGGSGGIVGYGSGTSPFGLEIGSGGELNTFFGSPFNPNNALGDLGWGNGFLINLGAGQSGTTTSYQAFGTSPTNAQNAFAAAIPEPATLAVFGGLALAGLAGYRRRKAGSPANGAT